MMSIAWPSECSPSPRQPPYSLTCGKCAQTVRYRVTARDTIPDSIEEPEGQGASETSPPPLGVDAPDEAEEEEEEDEDDDEDDDVSVAGASAVVRFGAAGFGGAGGLGL